MTQYTNNAINRRLQYKRGEGYYCQTFDGSQWANIGLIKSRTDAFEWLSGRV
jgi:hypothetical protein